MKAQRADRAWLRIGDIAWYDLAAYAEETGISEDDAALSHEKASHPTRVIDGTSITMLHDPPSRDADARSNRPPVAEERESRLAAWWVAPAVDWSRRDGTDYQAARKAAMTARQAARPAPPGAPIHLRWQPLSKYAEAEGISREAAQKRHQRGSIMCVHRDGGLVVATTGDSALDQALATLTTGLDEDSKTVLAFVLMYARA